MVGELEHPVDVVLDQQHRQIRRDALDDGADALALGGGETGQRLVEQQHARRGGERHAHVEQALAAIGQHAGFGLLDAGEAEIADGGVGLGVDRLDRQRIGDGIEALGVPRLHGEADVLADAERRKQIGDLERAADAGARDLLRRVAGDRLAQQRHRALVGRKHAGQQIERRGLAGAVGADQRMQRAVGDRDVDALHRLDAAEALDDVAGATAPRRRRGISAAEIPAAATPRCGAPTSRHPRWSSCGTARSAARRRRPARSARTR